MKRLSAMVCVVALLMLVACKASGPGTIETAVTQKLKQKITIGGKDWVNPTPNTPEVIKQGAEHFQHHCQICHGLDGHATGVPFAQKMDPPVPDLGAKEIQDYTDGQLKWIIENGIAPSGMPGWQGILDEEEMWQMVRYIRNLPPKGSLGPPAVYAEGEESHEGAKGEAKPHTHKDSKPHKH
ncbi:MAG TPA: cytochrome c [Terriglobales bacterium]|jgi:mono/diheme cytochrome c family protein|nr:cytochrome c [Terriglobales bacterium]